MRQTKFQSIIRIAALHVSAHSAVTALPSTLALESKGMTISLEAFMTHESSQHPNIDFPFHKRLRFSEHNHAIRIPDRRDPT